MAKHKDHGSSMKMVDPNMAAVGMQPQMTYQPPMPANQMGVAKPVFSPQTQVWRKLFTVRLSKDKCLLVLDL